MQILAELSSGRPYYHYVLVEFLDHGNQSKCKTCNLSYSRWFSFYDGQRLSSQSSTNKL